MAYALSGGSSSAAAAFVDLKVKKSAAKNGYTVGEIFSKAADLDKKKITVRGQIVKVSPGIMGKNWFHIQDGTGDPAGKTHDLVATSSAMAKKGDIVSFEGVLAAKKDIGSGYKYAALLEDAVILK